MKKRASTHHGFVIAAGVLLSVAATPAQAIESMSHAEESDDPPLNADQQAQVANLTKVELRQIDLALLANADRHWRKVARIVGTTMTSLSQRYKGIPDVFYAQRVQHLVAVGALESQGNLKRMRFSEVRIPARP